MLMAEWKDSQPQIIEILGKRVKIVEDSGSKKECDCCAFRMACSIEYDTLCIDANGEYNRHFVEVDEDGNEIK